MKEWRDEWTIVSNDSGVWVKYAPSGEAWRLAPARTLRVKDDTLSQTYRRLHGSDHD